MFKFIVSFYNYTLQTQPKLFLSLLLLSFALVVAEGAGLLLIIPVLELHASLELKTNFFTSLPILLLGFVVIALAFATIRYLHEVFGAKMQSQIVRRFQFELHDAILGTEWLMLLRRGRSNLLHLVASGAVELGLSSYALILLIVHVSVGILYLAFALWASWKVSLVVLVVGAIVGSFAIKSFYKIEEVAERQTNILERLYGRTIEQLDSLKLIKAYRNEAYSRSQFSNEVNDLEEVSVASTSEKAAQQAILFILSAVALALVVYFSLSIATISLSSVYFIIFLYARLASKVIAIHRVLSDLAGVAPEYNRVLELKDFCRLHPELVESNVPELKTSVSLENTKFAYAGLKPLFENLELRISKGETVALTGESGVGKTTIADIFLGLLHPSTGGLCIDAHLLNKAESQAWRRKTGYASGEAFALAGSCRENLLWANPEASECDLWKALKTCDLEDFIKSLPGELDALFKAKLSAGERARLSIARALVREPTLLVLDEVTSAVSTESEKRILLGIRQEYKNTAILIVSHRPSIQDSADRVYLLENKKLIEVESKHSK